MVKEFSNLALKIFASEHVARTMDLVLARIVLNRILGAVINNKQRNSILAA
jgi:hypothetical protein